MSLSKIETAIVEATSNYLKHTQLGLKNKPAEGDLQKRQCAKPDKIRNPVHRPTQESHDDRTQKAADKKIEKLAGGHKPAFGAGKEIDIIMENIMRVEDRIVNKS